MNIFIGVCLVLALVCFLYAKWCNGKGPEAGFKGLIAWGISFLLIAMAICATLFQAGRWYQ